MSEPMVEMTEADLPQNIKVLWLKALSAMEIHNYSYAISLANAVLKEAPGFLEARQLARNSAIKTIDASGQSKKSSAMTSFLSGGVSHMKLASVAKKNPEKALIQLEKELEKAPYDEGLNEVLFDAAIRLNLLDTAAFALETVRRGVPENTKMMHKLADHYISRDMPDKATDVYNDIVKQDPADIDAVKGAKDSSAKASMKKQQWEEAQSLNDLKKDAGQVAALEAADRTAMTRDQQREKLASLTQEYQQDQNNISVVKQIAQLYEEMECWQDAKVFYDWAYQISNGDAALKLKAGQLADKVANAELKELESQLEADPGNEELREKLKTTRKARAEEAVVEAEQRVESNPTDPQLRYELGAALHDAERYGDAIPHLQQATRNPHIRTKVLLTLARAFTGKGMLDLGVKQLTDALEDLHAMDAIKKEILYEKGVIHSKMNAEPEALECFKQIYEVDYGYRDVASRVEASYSS